MVDDEVLEARRESRGHFNVIHVPSGLMADVYPASRDPLHAWAITRTLRVPDRAALADWLERLGLEAQWRMVTDTST